MKVQISDTVIVVGKRISLGAALGSIAKIVATLFPDYAVVAYESAFVLTFVGQMILANYFGITIK